MSTSKTSSFASRILSHIRLPAMQPSDRPSAPPPTVRASLKAIVRHSWLNVLLVFIPVSWALHYAIPGQDVVIFIFTFIAIIPLANLLAFATDDLSMHTGQTIAGLLNATLGNAVELIVAIIALLKCELTLVQSSLIGSMLSNLLLVLGMCFFAGGVRFYEQGFSVAAAQINSSLLIISVVAVLLPAALHFSYSQSSSTISDGNSDITKVSHGVALLLLFTYVCYLIFQLYTHNEVYDSTGESVDVAPSVSYKLRNRLSTASMASATPTIAVTEPEAEAEHCGTDTAISSPTSTMTCSTFLGPPAFALKAPSVAFSVTDTMTSDRARDLEAGNMAEPVKPAKAASSNDEEPQMSVLVSLGLLAIVTVFVAVTSEYLVDSIDGLATTTGINKGFIGLILLPIVGNAAEHATAVTVSVKDKLTLSISVAVGSSIQIALFVIPFIVTLAWILGKPLTLLFDPFQSCALFLSVLTVNYVIQDGKSNWMEGMILMVVYVIIGTAVFFYDGVDLLSSCT